MSDVFCEGCRYCRCRLNFPLHVCTNEKNILFSKSAYMIHEDNPGIDKVNKNNDCNLFELIPPKPINVPFINRVFSKISLWYGLAFDCDEPMYVEPELGGGMCKETGMPE